MTNEYGQPVSAETHRRLLFSQMRYEAINGLSEAGLSSLNASSTGMLSGIIKVRPESVGILDPELVSLEQHDSSLVAALAIAISAVRGKESAHETFEQISPEARIHLTGGPRQADRIERARDTLRAVSGLKIPLLREVRVKPLVEGSKATYSDEMPLPRIFRVLQAGGAVVLPVDLKPVGMPSKKRKSVLWGAVTGYAQHNSRQLGPYSSVPVENAFDAPQQPEPTIDFVVGIASRSVRLQATLNNIQLGDVVNQNPEPIHTVTKNRR